MELAIGAGNDVSLENPEGWAQTEGNPHKTCLSAHAGEGAQAADGTRERNGQSKLVPLLFKKIIE
jgi:hypothetical protein